MFSQSFVVLSALLIAVNAQDCSQGPPRGVHPPECCPASWPKLISRANAEECGLPAEFADGPPSGPPSGPPPGPPPSGGPGGPRENKIPCESFQCALRKNNLLTADNKLNKAALKAQLESSFSGEWKPTVDKMIQACDASTDGASDDCEVRRYAMCLAKAAFLNCPSSVAVNSADCTTLRNFIQNCSRN